MFEMASLTAEQTTARKKYTSAKPIATSMTIDPNMAMLLY
jgi:hypothetical protein